MSHPEHEYRPATGVPAQPAFGERGGEKVDLHIGMFEDGRWSYLYGEDTEYGSAVPDIEAVREAARRARTGPLPDTVQGPVMKSPVWTWEAPAYFWLGGIAAGSSFVALACDLAGDERSAATARKVSLAAIAPAPVLLIKELGRPERFYKMLRIFKPRSPMSMGVWALTVFSNLAAAAVGADVLGRRKAARALGAANAVVGGYLGSYTGVLLAATAVPVWARSRLYLGPIFVCTATATGAATCRLVLSATGVPAHHPTRTALANVEAGAMGAELLLSVVNERQLGPIARSLEDGPPGRLFKAAKWTVRTGLLTQLVRRRIPALEHVASALYLVAGLLFRYAWIGAGPRSGTDDREVAEMARSKRHGT